MITEDYVSLGVAKLLKEKGFKEWCPKCYGFDARHNGEPIDVDEEYELRDAGRENEIEYVDGGRMYDYGCGNFNPGSPYAAPSLYVAMKWLREVHHLHCNIGYDNVNWHWDIQTVRKPVTEETTPKTLPAITIIGLTYSTYEDACEAAIKECLENLI